MDAGFTSTRTAHIFGTYEGVPSIRGHVYCVPTHNSFGLRDEGYAKLIQIADDFDKSKAVLQFGNFVRIYKPSVVDGTITVTNSSAIFKTSTFAPLAAAPAISFPLVGCLERVVTSEVGIYETPFTVKVVNMSAVRQAKFGKMCKAVCKDVIGRR